MGARMFLRDPSVMATPRAEAGVTAHDGRLGAIVRYGQARASDPLGSATVHAINTGLALTLAYSKVIETGPRIELGAVVATGDGSRSSSKVVFASSFVWEIEAHLRATSWLDFLLTAELGWMWRGLDVRADDRTILEIGGPFAGASLGALLY
jgi:hypothetical protein